MKIHPTQVCQWYETCVLRKIIIPINNKHVPGMAHGTCLSFVTAKCVISPEWDILLGIY